MIFSVTNVCGVYDGREDGDDFDADDFERDWRCVDDLEREFVFNEEGFNCCEINSNRKITKIW